MSRNHPILTADWLEACFIHFRVDASRLQRRIPLELDRFKGHAYVSLVAFTQQNLRPVWGGRVARWLASPVAHHAFLNVRTYVKLGQARGILFLTEWIPNRLAAMIGPRTFGLPYRLGRLRYTSDSRTIIAGGGRLTLDVQDGSAGLRPAPTGTLDHWLLERYIAWTCRRGVIRRFDVHHAAWLQRRAEVRLKDDGLLAQSGDWFADAELAGANYSPGVRDVTISGPGRVRMNAAEFAPPESVIQ